MNVSFLNQKINHIQDIYLWSFYYEIAQYIAMQKRVFILNRKCDGRRDTYKSSNLCFKFKDEISVLLWTANFSLMKILLYFSNRNQTFLYWRDRFYWIVKIFEFDAEKRFYSVGLYPTKRPLIRYRYKTRLNNSTAIYVHRFWNQ